MAKDYKILHKKYINEEDAYDWIVKEKERLINLNNEILNDDVTNIYNFKSQKRLWYATIYYKQKGI